MAMSSRRRPYLHSLMMPPIIILIALLIVNSGVRRYWPSWALVRGELITIYAMLTVSVILSGWACCSFSARPSGLCRTSPRPNNQWMSYLGYVAQLDHAEAVGDRWVLQWRECRSLERMAVAILCWSGFLFTMLFCMFCINTIVLRQWTIGSGWLSR